MSDRLQLCREIGAMTALRQADAAPSVRADGAADATQRAVIWAQEAGRMDAFAAVYAALGKADLAAAHQANAALYWERARA